MAVIAKEVGIQMLRLLTAFPDARRDTKMTLAVYVDGMRGVSVPALTAAVDRAIRELRFLPAVAELRDFATSASLTAALEDARPKQDRGPPFVSWHTDGTGIRREGETDEDVLWRHKVRNWVVKKRRGYWPDTWGPTPAEPGCRVPWRIMREFDLEPVPFPEKAPLASRDPGPAPEPEPQEQRRRTAPAPRERAPEPLQPDLITDDIL